MRPHLPVVSTAHSKHRKCQRKCRKDTQNSASDKHLQHQKCTDISQCSDACDHQYKCTEITMDQFHRNLEKQPVMAINTCHIVCIRHSLIYIINRVKICMCMIIITLFASSVNVRRIHAVKDQNHKCRIDKPDDPFAFFLLKRKVLVHPEKHCKLCQKQKDHHCRRLCVPTIFHRNCSYLFSLS